MKKTVFPLVMAAAFFLSTLAAPHVHAAPPAVEAYREASALFNKDPEAAAKRAEDALALLPEDAQRIDRAEIELFIVFARHSAEPDNRRRFQALLRNLESRDDEGLQDTTLVVRAWFAVSGYTVRRERWRNLTDYGERTEKALLAVAPDAIDPLATAITFQGLGHLNGRDQKRSKNQFKQITQAIDDFHRGMQLYTEPLDPDNLNQIEATLHGWYAAARALLLTLDPREAERYLETLDWDEDPESEEPDPCDAITWRKREVSYPRSAARRGYVGAAIFAFDLTPEGRVTNIRVLAEVPNIYFAPAAKESMKDWQAEFPDDLPAECFKNRTVRVDFILD